MDNFNFESLNIFLTVSKFRSFSRASNYLYLDSSTISKKIRQLEKAVNRQLFARTNQGVELTSAGVAFRKNAQKLLTNLKELTAPPTIDWDTLRIGILVNGYQPCYWESERGAEIDFVIQRDGGIIPVEVKAADNTKAKSLKVYMDTYRPAYAIKLSARNFGFDDGKKTVPLYAAFCI